MGQSENKDINQEEKIFFADHLDEKQLLGIEKSLIQKIQKNPKEHHSYYLLSLLYLKIFSKKIFAQADSSLNKDRSSLIYLKSAIELAEETIAMSPNQDKGYVAMAYILDAIAETDQAKTYLERAPKTLESWRLELAQIRILHRKTSFYDVFFLLSQLTKHTDLSKEIFTSTVLEQAEEKKGQDFLLSLYESQPSVFKIYSCKMNFYLSDIYIKMDQAKKAIDTLKKAVCFDLASEAEKNLRLDLFYIQDSKNKHAAESLEKLLMHSKDLSEELKKIGWMNLGIYFLNEKTKAMEANAIFLKQFEDQNEILQANFLRELAKIYEAKKQIEAFSFLLRDIIRIRPAVPENYLFLGQLYMKQSQYRKSMSYLLKAKVLDPMSPDIQEAIGLNYYYEKNFYKALESINEGLRLAPDHADLHYNKACILALLNRKEESLVHLQKALEADPRLIESARSDPDFENIRNMEGFLRLLNF